MFRSVIVAVTTAVATLAGSAAQAHQPQRFAAPGSATATGSTTAKTAIRSPGTCEGKGLGVRPRGIRFICVRDAHSGGQNLDWRRWGGRKAIAVGFDSYAWPSTASPRRSWKARFVLSRPRTVGGKHIYTRLKVIAKEPIFWGAKRRGISRVERFHAVFRQTEGVPAPCVFQWVNPRYANGPLICETAKPGAAPTPGTSNPQPTTPAPAPPPTPAPQPVPSPPPAATITGNPCSTFETAPNCVPARVAAAPNNTSPKLGTFSYGQALTARCWTTGQTITDGNNADPSDDARTFTSNLWFGIEWNGARGYVAATWTTKSENRLGLPGC